MKTIFKYIILPVAALAAMAACQTNDEKITLQGLDGNTEIELVASKSAVVLLPETSSDLGLQFAWSVPELTLSKYGVAQNALTYRLEFSTDADFGSVTTVDATGNSQTFTVGAVNVVMNRLPVVFDAANDIYVRLAVYSGPNMDPVYSNTQKVAVTPFELDFTLLTLVTKADYSEMGLLYSPEIDGVYTGFVYFTAWTDFYFRAADGSLIGSAPNTGNPFKLKYTSDTGEVWNAWSTGVNGWYYVVADLNSMEWTATLFTAIDVAGDASGTLKYSSTSQMWEGAFATAAGNASVYLSAAGSKYDYSSATDDSKTTPVTIWFESDGPAMSGQLEVTTAQPSQMISIATADTYTAAVDLRDPRSYTYSIVSGGEIPDDLPAELYMWYQNRSAYHTILSPYAPVEGVYQGFYNAAAGEAFYLSDNAVFADGTVYGCEDSSQTLVSVDGANFTTALWALWFDNTAAYNYVQVDLKNDDWTPYKINGFALVGNFDWIETAHPFVQDASDPDVWSVDFTISDPAKLNQIQVLAFVDGAGKWDNKMQNISGSGKMDWSGSNANGFTGRGNWDWWVDAVGTYTFTMNLGDDGSFSYTIVAKP